jgi:hypothetical protein
LTTIAANKDSIACDLQATHSGGYKFKLATKIGEFYQPLMYPTKFWVGFSGNVDAIPDIMDFYTNMHEYKKAPKIGGSECLVLTADKKLFTFVNPSKWLELKEKNYAVGSGAMFAMGAMEAGKTPLEAVKIASKKDPMTGMGFKNYTL